MILTVETELIEENLSHGTLSTDAGPTVASTVNIKLHFIPHGEHTSYPL
jgi:hypothetical protein